MRHRSDTHQTAILLRTGPPPVRHLNRGVPSAQLTREVERLPVADLLPQADGDVPDGLLALCASGYPRHWAIPRRREERIRTPLFRSVRPPSLFFLLFMYTLLLPPSPLFLLLCA
jgi:hypothetical protein